MLKSSPQSYNNHLHELEGPDGGEEVLLRLVARYVLLQSLRALRELQCFFSSIQRKLCLTAKLSSVANLEHSGVNLLIFAVQDILDKLHVIRPHSHLEAAEKLCF